MFDSLFDLHLVVVGGAILILLCAFALGGLAIFSRHILPRLKLGPEESVFTSAMMQAVVGFYWLAVAFIGGGVLQTPTEGAATLFGGGSGVGGLLRPGGGCPPPVRAPLPQ